MLIELSTYEFESLRTDEEFTLYRGRGAVEPSSILVLTPVSQQPELGTIKRLEHECSFRDELDPEWAVRPMGLTRHWDRLVLVLEDPGGEPLDRFLGPARDPSPHSLREALRARTSTLADTGRQPMELGRFLRLGISLATGLSKLHGQGLIHKDVKPANVLVDSITNKVRFTGFGICSRLVRERQAAEPPEMIAGTLAYMAPEQTGWMNRSIDSRSDLYSLGVTFFQMLTGSLPFTASDPMEWVHCHIARQPITPDQYAKEIPAPLSAIVMKLLAKTAEERYQTAAGVAGDLRHCLEEWQAHRRIDRFQLGTHDVSDRLLIPEKLYGREREIEALLGSFDRVVANGAPELVLVSGYSGIGKSSVVHELHKVLVPPRGRFASGKFDQYKRDIPYATLAQAFQSLVRPLLGQREAELGWWRNALREALGLHGQLIVNLVPALELVIGKQPPLPELPPQDAQNRFQMVFRRFLGVFARKEHPLTLFLDDLQWLDIATLDLLEHLVTHSEVRHLLLVGAYRDNEVGPAHPLLRTLETIRNAGAKVQEIVLAPLGLDDVGRLVADGLHCEPEHVRPLAQLVQEKTGGNPFFAIQFFTALAEEGLLSFDPVEAAWRWDIDRIRAKSYTDNVVDLMAGRLKRLSATTQEALKQLACLGNVAGTATLALIHGETEEVTHAALWEAVRGGLVFCQDSAYKFLHDRIQQAAYTLIPEEHRAEVHLRIGRVLLASMTATELAEHLFDVANQFSRGAARLVDRDEKAQVATIDLRAGRRAKASAAYASACVYLAAGMALLDDGDWSSQYELKFSLLLECAECEFLTANFDKAEQLIGELLQRGASKVDQAAVCHLKVLLHTVKSENAKAVDSALACLRLVSIDIPARPTWEQVQAEYEMVWQTLDRRPIESLIDLPLMTDPELKAAMQVLSVFVSPAYFTDFHLHCLLVCRMVNISMQDGTSGASAHGYGYLGALLGPLFHRYREGFCFTKLACDLVDKHGFVAYQAKAYYSMGLVALWTQPITTAINFTRATFRTATETGDLTFACYSMWQSVTCLLLRGRTATFSTFSDAQFDEVTFEAQLKGDRMTVMICLYWIVKLKTRFLSGDYAEALAAADKAKALLWTSAAQIQLLDYFYYTALTVAALYENATADEQTEWRELLTAHREQLREWADNYSPTFTDKHTLVSAELARLEGRDLDAMRLYEEAIRAARENGFVQNEGLANEVAAQFYLKRGIEKVAHSFLRDARYCYLRWGALGKVKQLDERYPAIEERSAVRPTSTIGTSVEQLDLGTVMKASQAVAGEIVLQKLIKTLMMIAVEHAGAERGLLVLPHGEELRIAAEARTGYDGVEVQLKDALVTPSEIPDALLQYVIRTQESVILDDASTQNLFSQDEYFRQGRSRSLLCLPLLKQVNLVGVLYLENSLAPHVFTPNRLAMLELLASQAAISLENTRLYRDLEEREAKIRRLVDANIMGIFIWNLEGEIIEANDAFLTMLEYSREDVVSLRRGWRDLTPAEWRDRDERAVADLKATGTARPYQKELLRKDGSRAPVMIGAATFEGSKNEGVAFVLDLSEQKRAEDERNRAEEALQKAQAELAHVTRVTTLGELTTSIAHEINQPLGALVNNAGACLRWLKAQNLEEARRSASLVIADGHRAGEIISRIRALAKKAPPQKDWLDLNHVIGEVVALARNELQRNRVSLQTQLSNDLPLILGDRIQLQQVILNLLINAIEAMSGVSEGPRELWVSSEKVNGIYDESEEDTLRVNGLAEAKGTHVLVGVRDSGPGLDPNGIARVFDAFYTTKSQGMGMGLAISRSIVEAHGGRLWATPNAPKGALFQFALPISHERIS